MPAPVSGKVLSPNNDGDAVFPLYPFCLLSDIVMFALDDLAVSGGGGVV